MDTVDATAPLSITLQAQQWNQLLSLLAEGPYRVAAPLIAAITTQAQAGARAEATMTARPNGEDLRA